MNILIEAGCLVPGNSCGIENFVYSLVRGLVQSTDHKIFINIAPGTRDSYEKILDSEKVTYLEDRVQFYLIDKYHRSSCFKSLFQFVKFLGFHGVMSDQFEVPRKSWALHCETLVDAVLYPMRYRIAHLNRPSVVVVHDVRDLDRGGEPELEAERRRIGNASALVTSWPHPFSLLTKFFPERKKDIFMIPFLFDPIPADEPEPVTLQSRQFLYPASNGPDKNHEVLIRALGILKSSGCERIRVLCPGAQSDARKELLDGLIREARVEEWIQFLGFVPRAVVHDLYRSSTAVIATTKYEAFSGAVMEAFSYGKPVACSNIPSLTEMIDRLSVKVRYFNPDDPSDVAQAMLDILADPQPYRAGSIKARKALAGISLEGTARQYSEVLSWVCGKAAKPLWFPCESALLAQGSHDD